MLFLEDLINEHKLKLEEENPDNVDERHNNEFSSWAAQRVIDSPELYAEEIRTLSLGPLKHVKCYTGCMVNGYKFHTQSREEGRKTQHSGVVVPGSYGNNMIDYYGVLQDVLELEYLGDGKRVLVFKCDWFKLDGPLGCQVDKECGLTSINVSRKWYMDQPYVLASQVRQVFYVDDLKLGKDCVVVQSFARRAVYDVPMNSESVEEEGVSQEEVNQEEVYQEVDLNFTLVADLNMEVPSLTRDFSEMQGGIHQLCQTTGAVNHLLLLRMIPLLMMEQVILDSFNLLAMMRMKMMRMKTMLMNLNNRYVGIHVDHLNTKAANFIC
ncbi:hypothetical protein OROGR_017121 [Orobanche gracilis]